MRSTCGLLMLAVAVAACGGGASDEQGWTENTEESTGADDGDSNDGMQIQGLMGTLTREDVNRGLEPRMNRFMRCFSARYGSLDVLGGHFELAFRVAVDGSVLWVYPRRSSIGDRATERCLLEVAAATRFRPPRGNGEAEFGWPLELDAPEDVRPPLNWDSMQVSATLAEHMREMLDGCPVAGTAGFEVTAYVAPGGRVMAAGAAADTQVAPEALDCVTDMVLAWPMPDPGSYPAKVTFAVR